MKDLIYTMFIVAIIVGVLLIQESNFQKTQTQIDELRILFNQKFLQEMVVNKPEIRDI